MVKRKKVGTTLKTVWVGSNRKVGVKKERMAIKKYGDAILTSGPIRMNSKIKYGYALSVPSNLFKKKRK